MWHTPCQAHRQRVIGPTGAAPIGAFVPQCRPDGGYEKTQCESSGPICWCVDVNGEEIPNTRLSGTPDCGKPGTMVLNSQSLFDVIFM